MDIVFEIKNNQAINRNSIPAVDFETFRKTVISQDIRVINLFWQEENYKDRLYAVIADEPNKKLFVTSCFVGEEYPSLTLDKPCLHMFERLIYEEGGIKPIGHPFLKPVRKQENYDLETIIDFCNKFENVKTISVPTLKLLQQGEEYYLEIKPKDKEAELIDKYEIWIDYVKFDGLVLENNRIRVTEHLQNAGLHNFRVKALAIESNFVRDSAITSIQYSIFKQLNNGN